MLQAHHYRCKAHINHILIKTVPNTQLQCQIMMQIRVKHCPLANFELIVQVLTFL